MFIWIRIFFHSGSRIQGSKKHRNPDPDRNNGIVPKFILERKELLYPCRVEWTVGCRAWFLNNPPAVSNHRKQLTSSHHDSVSLISLRI
jgi:hypothetical protein